jgi:phospholipase/carboxylesterase
LVVRGSDEKEILALVDHLPVGPTYAAVRAPIAENGGYTRFANRGSGRPVAESLRATMDWFRRWLDEVAARAGP